MAVNAHLESLKKKVDDRSARIGVVGLGYVGLPLSVEFAEAGFRVLGIDVDAAKVRNIRAGRSHVEDVPSDVVARLARKKLLSAQDHYRGCGKLDAVFIAVPTPLRKTRDPDISYIVSALDESSNAVQ